MSDGKHTQSCMSGRRHTQSCISDGKHTQSFRGRQGRYSPACLFFFRDTAVSGTRRFQGHGGTSPEKP